MGLLFKYVSRSNVVIIRKSFFVLFFKEIEQKKDELEYGITFAHVLKYSDKNKQVSQRL